MKQTLHNKSTGINYTRVGDVYLPNLVLPRSDYTVGVWGERYRTYLKTQRKPFYTSLKMQCKLDAHLRKVDTRANEMYNRLVQRLASQEGITEQLKACDMIAWVTAMNNISNRTREIVWNEITNN